MSDGDAVLKAVLADPADDLPRHAYADYLEEHGRAAHAEFVRLQLRLDSRARTLPDGTHRTWREEESHVVVRSWLPREKELAADPDGAVAAAAALFRPRRVTWFWWQDVGNAQLQDADDTSTVLFAHLRFRRGFVDRVTCRLDCWLRHGKALRAAHPVASVEASDREPSRHYRPPLGERYWCRRHGDTGHLRDRLPPEVYALLPRPGAGEDEDGVMTYASREVALGALSAALLSLARGD